MIQIGFDIICLYRNKKIVAKIEDYLGNGMYKIYMYQDKKYGNINCKNILEVFEA